MAKHDQRILKFLNQNADRAPTITEMMTRLNISISDISDSLGSLHPKASSPKRPTIRESNAGFPTGPQAAPQMAQPVQGSRRPNLSASANADHDDSHPRRRPAIPVNRSGMDSRFTGGLSERPFQAPDPPASPAQSASCAGPAYSHGGTVLCPSFPGNPFATGTRREWQYAHVRPPPNPPLRAESGF